MQEKNKKYIAHVVPEYLGHTMNWIYTQIKYQKKYSSYVLTQKAINTSSYPVDMIFTSRESGYSLKDPNVWERLQRRFGRLPFEERHVFLSTLRKFPPIAIQAHFGWDSYFSLCLKNELNLPLISRFYGYDLGVLPQIPLWKKRYFELFSKGDLFLVEGNFMKNTLHLLGCPLNKILVNRLGIEVDLVPFSEKKFLGNKLRVLMAASFKHKKGLEYGLVAVARARNLLPNKEISLTVIGDGELRGHLEYLAQKYELSDITKWEGYKPHDYFIKSLVDTDIYIAPSITAEDGDTEGGAPVAIIEAGAAGVPVISSFHADIPEVIINGETGILCQERDVEALAQSIYDLANNKDLALVMGRRARDHIASAYSANDQGIELANIYSRFC
jgi:colanic acid/amylovoran biosynthesis glycosyltransferase